MKFKWRRMMVLVVSLVVLGFVIAETAPPVIEQIQPPVTQNTDGTQSAAAALERLSVKGRAPKSGYARDQFGSGWTTVKGCDTRNIILYRDLENTVLDDEFRVVSGVLHDSYTGETIQFSRSEGNAIQIDHVVALSDSWQKGAQLLTRDVRVQLANDPLELIAVDGPANQEKGDGDAATWLPPNKPFRCEYVARQIAIKQKYSLWVTAAEKEAIKNVLTTCPGQVLPAK